MPVSTRRTSRWRGTDRAVWPEFPFDSAALNGLVVSEALIDMARELLAVEDVRLYQATLTAKYPDQSSGYNQLLHTDFPNHTILVPRRTRYQQLETYIYLSDVSTHNGATRLVSRRSTEGIAVERHTLPFDKYPTSTRSPVTPPAPAGSVVAYRPDVYHRSVDFSERGDPGSCSMSPTRRREPSGPATRPGLQRLLCGLARFRAGRQRPSG